MKQHILIRQQKNKEMNFWSSSSNDVHLWRRWTWCDSDMNGLSNGMTWEGRLRSLGPSAPLLTNKYWVIQTHRLTVHWSAAHLSQSIPRHISEPPDTYWHICGRGKSHHNLHTFSHIYKAIVAGIHSIRLTSSARPVVSACGILEQIACVLMFITIYVDVILHYSTFCLAPKKMWGIK